MGGRGSAADPADFKGVERVSWELQSVERLTVNVRNWTRVPCGNRLLEPSRLWEGEADGWKRIRKLRSSVGPRRQALGKATHWTPALASYKALWKVTAEIVTVCWRTHQEDIAQTHRKYRQASLHAPSPPQSRKVPMCPQAPDKAVTGRWKGRAHPGENWLKVDLLHRNSSKWESWITDTTRLGPHV